MKLWYEQPAAKWEEAMPVGNGRLGAMMCGDVTQETIWLNEDSVWSGKPVNRINPDAKENLPKVRRLIREGKIPEAEELALLALCGTPNSQRSYETAGELYLQFRGKGEVRHYRRELDLEQGVASVSYEMGQTRYERKLIASYPDQVLILHMEAQGPDDLQFVCRLERCHNRLDEVCARGDSLWLQVDGGEGISFLVCLSVRQEGGTIRSIGEHLSVEGAKKATLYLNIVTSFRETAFQEACRRQLALAADKGWDQCFAAHRADYQALFDRLHLTLGKDEEKEEEPTNRRLQAIREGKEDVGLFALYFQYGRYLLLSASRGECLPANLQGIWNHRLTPPWDSKFTININTEMNYWPADSGNLSECHLPYFLHLKKIMENGRRTAEQMYGCRGSVAHHNVDLYGDTAPQDLYIAASIWPMGEAWLATHIYEHYLYTQDRDFLEEYFPVIQASLDFFEDFLIEDEQGRLLISPSVSPENTYIRSDGVRGCLCEGATMDIEILSELLRGYLGACEVLQKPSVLSDRANRILERLPKLGIGRHGQLKEWLEDYDEAEPGHRHISHLYGVYPGSSITWQDTPELMRAARITLERRLSFGGGHTGWSRAWIIGLWAKFLDGDKVYENLHALLADSTFPNLMDNHPMGDGYVFQIDGNLGATAAMIEMLVQCRNGEIHLLPALPKQFGEGSVKGVLLRGGITLSMQWKNQKVLQASFLSAAEQSVTVYANGEKKEVMLQAGVTSLTWDSPL